MADWCVIVLMADCCVFFICFFDILFSYRLFFFFLLQLPVSPPIFTMAHPGLQVDCCPTWATLGLVGMVWLRRKSIESRRFFVEKIVETFWFWAPILPVLLPSSWLLTLPSSSQVADCYAQHSSVAANSYLFSSVDSYHVRYVTFSFFLLLFHPPFPSSFTNFSVLFSPMYFYLYVFFSLYNNNV